MSDDGRTFVCCPLSVRSANQSHLSSQLSAKATRMTENSPGSNTASSILVVGSPAPGVEQYIPLTCTPFFSHDNEPVSFETQSISHLFASQPTLERTSAYALFPLPLTNSAASSTREDPVPLCPIWVENSIARAPQLHSPCQVPR